MPATIISHFAIPGAFIRSKRFGSGLINDTYLCEFDDNGSRRGYILQRINTSVFKRPDEVMHNVETVTTHIVERLRTEGLVDPLAMTPVLIKTRGRRSFYDDDSGGCWRAFHFIENGVVFDTVQNRRHAHEIGRGVGRFHSLVSDLSPDQLHDTLPGFHYTPNYLSDYDTALKADVKKRAAGIAGERAFIYQRRSLAPVLTDLIASSDLPLRVVHNDPKVSNIMIHRETGMALCMLDLDTVKPGIVHFDFGDCVRSAANPAGENAADLGTITFDRELFEAVAEGYFSEAGVFLTHNELAMLPVSVLVITFELGIRFLSDYLRGDIYFKIDHPEHNLHRARVQFKLLEGLEASQERMTLFVRKLAPVR
jgi:Ser/Thr protein kinase RdoA (MazF antagonist)